MAKGKSGRGAGRESGSAYVDEQGRLCIGNKCVTLKVGATDEVHVEIDRDGCTPDELKAIDRLKDKVIGGAPTVYRFGSPRK